MLILRETRCFAEGVLHLGNGVVEGVVMHCFGVECCEALDAVHAPFEGLLVGHDKFIYTGSIEV